MYGGNPSAGLTNSDSPGATDNITPERSLYPDANGATIGAASGGISLVSTALPGGVPGAAGSGPAAGGLLGQPLTWWAALIVLFVVLGFVAKKAGNAGEFGNIRVSAWNVLMITLAAIIGIAGFKALFSRFPVPGITTLVNAV